MFFPLQLRLAEGSTSAVRDAKPWTHREWWAGQGLLCFTFSLCAQQWTPRTEVSRNRPPQHTQTHHQVDRSFLGTAEGEDTPLFARSLWV